MTELKVINWSQLNSQIEVFTNEFHGKAVEHIVIDGFLDDKFIEDLCLELPDPIESKISKSRDYMFASNKYEKSDIATIGENMGALKQALLGEEFKLFLNKVTGQNVFVDPSFHGGGLHQGGTGSYLNMHTDFNYHPLHPDWFRNLNILVYLNKNWQKEHGGELKLKHRISAKEVEIAPTFNRCVVMYTRDYTLHGYDEINFPLGEYRRSVAAYAYSIDAESESLSRSTTWYVENEGLLKKTLGLCWPKLVSIKTKLFGSGTSKNK